MKRVFSSVEVSETVLVCDALLHHGIGASIQNQNSAYASTPAFRPPAEVWIQNNSDFDKAREIVRQTLAALDSPADEAPWSCPRCKEQNPQSFDVCWNCAQAREH